MRKLLIKIQVLELALTTMTPRSMRGSCIKTMTPSSMCIKTMTPSSMRGSCIKRSVVQLKKVQSKSKLVEERSSTTYQQGL